MLRRHLIILAYAPAILADTVSYYWELTWVWGAPDGFGRPIIGVNNTWPCPAIEANVNDTVVINLTNSLGNETTGIHFHGIDQIDSNGYDGAAGTNQCPIPPGSTITYSFQANDAGSFWCTCYSTPLSHLVALTVSEKIIHIMMGQYPDGFRGPLIIRDPSDPYLDQYDDDMTITITDWYHSQTPTLVQQMIVPNNTNFTPPHPDAILVNDGGNGQIAVDAGKTYRFRIMNLSALTAAFVVFASLQMQVIMVDASYVQKAAANQLRVSPSQRCDVLVTIGDSDSQNYPFLVALDTNEDYTIVDADPPLAFHLNYTGQLVVDSSGDLNGTTEVDTWYPIDDTTLLPYDNASAYGPITKQWVMNFDYCFDANGYPRACFNDTTFIDQIVPSLYSVVSLGDNNTEATAYGQVNPFIVAYGDVVDIVVNNHNTAIHPFHLHGHQFQVIYRPPSNSSDWTGSETVPATPMRRDTVSVFPNSHVVLRIVANNPGVYLFHCHIEWHVELGLTATLIEAPEKLVDYQIPQDMLDVCNAQGIPTTGNAAGNADWSDTDGFITINPTTYEGAVVATATADSASTSSTTDSASATSTG
ncbi:multicopper oxidase [Xylariaceae sp. FL0255]|nr:multicopper oxidase [Xylariaceae sp. FL0255]